MRYVSITSSCAGFSKYIIDNNHRYHVPSHLSAHIDHLTPGVMASAPLQKVKAKRTLNNNRRDTKDTSAKIPYISPTSTSSCGEYITPACLKASTYANGEKSDSNHVVATWSSARTKSRLTLIELSPAISSVLGMMLTLLPIN